MKTKLDKFLEKYGNTALKYTDKDPICELCEFCFGECDGACWTWTSLFNELKKEYKPVLTNDEKVILKRLPSSCKWIARDNSGDLYLYAKKPCKNSDMSWWGNQIALYSLSIYNSLFKFIKWEDEEPYSIEELLKDE